MRHVSSGLDELTTRAYNMVVAGDLPRARAALEEGLCGVTGSGVTDSGVTDDGVTDDGGADHGVTDTGAAGTGATDTGAAGAGATDTGAAGAEHAGASVAPDLAEAASLYARVLLACGEPAAESLPAPIWDALSPAVSGVQRTA
jgi:hypothetical protein